MVGAIFHIKGNSSIHFSCISNHDRSGLLAPPKPTSVKISQPQPYWASLQGEVETYLKQAIPMKEPLVVFEPMHHLAFAAPKTILPALCLAACELVGGDRQQAMAAASALQLLHASIYTHEQLPLTNKPKPKPKPRGFHAYCPGIELLTGDGMAPFGFELLARSNDPARGNSDRILRVMIEISRAVGSEGVIHGLYEETLGSQSNGGVLCHVESIERAVEKNEGRLHSCGAACGAMLGGGSQEEIEKLRQYGFHIGMMQGMLQRGLRKEVEEERNLALNVLQFFKGRGVDAISSFSHL